MKDYFYIFSGRTRYYVNHEIYSAINQINNRVHYLQRRTKQCFAGKKASSQCDGDCNVCKFYMSRMESIDNTWMIPGRREPSLEDIAACTEILDAMQEIDPDGRLIGRLYLGGCRDVDIAGILGFSQSAYARRKAKIKAHLRKYIRENK